MLIVCLLFSYSAMSYTECNVTLENVWVGDDGHMWLAYVQSGSAHILPTDPDFDHILSTALVAVTTGNTVRLRYSANNVNCASTGRTDVVGLYLYNRVLP